MTPRQTRLRRRLIAKHIELVSNGKYEVASKILDFLNYGYVHLGLDDTSWECESIFENLRMYIYINSRTGGATCSLRDQK